MKNLIRRLIDWIDAGVDAKTKVTVGLLFLGIWGITFFAYNQSRDQRNDAKENIQYLRKQNTSLQEQINKCNQERTADMTRVAERSQRAKEIQDSILNIIRSLKKDP
jgi:cell division protein FtsB